MHSPPPPGSSSESLAFKQPPLDGSLLLPQIIDNHANDNPTYPLFRYIDLDGALNTIPWSRAIPAFQKAAQFVREQVAEANLEERPVIAILGSIDQITYFSLIAGVMRAGYQVFPVSPRNSELAVSHLLQATNCSHVIVSADATAQKQAECAVAAITTQGGILKVIPTPSFEELFSASVVPEVPPVRNLQSGETGLILHSSGSVAFPKVVKITYQILMEIALTPYYGELDFCGQVWAGHGLPTFHFIGVMQLFWAAMTGLTISLLPPIVPPIVPTPARVLDEAVATGSTVLMCVPSFLEGWARDPARIAALKKFNCVVFAGGPLQPAVGDMLIKNNVNLTPSYGCTEAGCLSRFLPKSSNKENWSYFHMSPHLDPVFLPLADTPNVYRLVLKKCGTHTPAVLDTIHQGVPAFNTNDLLVRHPENEKLWRLYGRQDDQIMHSNGEKTNPGPLEAIILKDPKIKHAVMFGRSQFNAGVLLFPAQPFNPAEGERVVEFRREIWPAIQEANEYAPSHSRIFKEMIVVANPSKPIELTAKGTPRRAMVLEIYKDEIRDAYAAVEESSQTHLTPPDIYDALSTLNFVRTVVREVLTQNPSDDEDIFQHGCDSLQATWIRNSILHALRASTKVDLGTVPGDFVYSHPTITLLGDFMTKVGSGSSYLLPDLSRRASAMEKMVGKYTQEFPEHCATVEKPNAEAVLITGTTGALGSYMLAHLLALPEVSAVYAVNRPGASIQDRQRTSFSNFGIDVQLLASPKLRLLEGTLATSGFGLSSDVYSEIRERVTCIIHNAWQVDFKMSLSSMEPCVAATRNLINLALSSGHTAPPQFIFVSTAGVFRSCEGPILEDNISDARTAAGLGYGESKWVAEQILETVAQRTALNPVIVRPGQLSGGIGGVWKTSEWFPTLLRSSQLLGHLPMISGHISWVPIHYAAKILIEMRTSRERYLHLTHAHPIPFSDVLLPVAEALELPMIPYSQWMASLEAAAARESLNPGVRLLHFFRTNRAISLEDEAFFPGPLSNSKAVEAACFMPSVPQLGARDAQEWVLFMRKVGYLL
ncbi:hypothetical protein DFH09DRAFT_1149378 [Mycena vulgaris]|nr:hypothetical protein DFH09DRAFT_1149378 [Mycena vulgaris]